MSLFSQRFFSRQVSRVSAIVLGVRSSIALGRLHMLLLESG
jgi:hypothetical protein